MSHATVMVKVVAKRLAAHRGDLNSALAEMLAPYSEQTEDKRFLTFKESDEAGEPGYWYNPHATWDWWVIGGRWSGFFPLKPTAHRVLGESGAFDNKPRAGRGDIVRISHIDMDAVTAEATIRAETFWKEWQRFLSGEKFRAFDGPRGTAMSIGLLRVVQGFASSDTYQKAIPWRDEVNDDDERKDWHDVAKVIDHDRFLSDYLDCFNPIKTYAALDNDGWHAPGRLGWFGYSSDEAEDYVKFAREFMSRFVNSSAPEDILVVVDYHI